jgi:translation initiation factor 1 (eIF-1/SUI1)
MLTAMKKKRIDIQNDGQPLTDNPFAGLAGSVPADLPQQEPPAEATAPASSGPSYRVAKSRKGNWPLALERRPGGKSVTVLRNVSGDAKALLKTLQKRCATGGVLREDAIELQGDHREAVEKFLNEGM